MGGRDLIHLYTISMIPFVAPVTLEPESTRSIVIAMADHAWVLLQQKCGKAVWLAKSRSWLGMRAQHVELYKLYA